MASTTARPRRALWIASEYPPFVFGGLGTHVFELTRALARAGLAVDLIVPEQEGYALPPDGVTLHGVPVDAADSELEFWLLFSHGAVALAQRENLRGQVVHCHDWLTGLAGAALSRLQGTPFVMSIHLPQRDAEHVAMESAAVAASDRVVVNSGAVRQELRRRAVADGTASGHPGRRTVVIPNGVDVDRFRPGADPTTDDLVLFVGRLVAQKGVDWLMKAFAVVATRLPEARLLLVGDGDQRLYVLRLARHLGISGRVTLAGWKTGDELVRAYQRASVVVVPSWYEPFGIVALEAMACGRAVVCSRTGGLGDLVVDGLNGFTVEPGDYLLFAAHVAQLLVDADLRRRLGEAARETARRFSWSSVASQTLALYDEVVQDARRPSVRGVREVLAHVSPLLVAVERTEVDELLHAVEGNPPAGAGA